MTSDEFTIYTGSKNIFQVKSNNTAQIAGWTITSNSISKGTTSLSASGTNGKITTSNIEINGGSISITKTSGSNSYHFTMGVSTEHPSCSGLNVGWGGINMNGQGMSSNGSQWTIGGGVYSNYITANT
jgi:hypothetical protein